jgi:hypothetical protein
MNKSWRQRIQAHKRDVLIGLAIFVVTSLVFLASRVHQVGDSRYSMLLSQSLLEHGSFTLERYQIPGVERTESGYVKAENLYQLELIDGHVYYIFPPGSSVLSMPYVALMKLFGFSAADADGNYNLEQDVKLQFILAAVLMAALACLFFFTSRLVLSVYWSVLVALGGAWGTQVWSTASRALWSDTWGILLLGLVIWMLLAAAAGKRALRPILLASLLAWLYFVRPTYAIPIFAITVYMLKYHRRLFLWYALTGIIWLICFIAYSRYNYGQLLPNYYLASRLTFDHFTEALAGNLISPARGLLIYVPVLFFIFYLLARYRRHLAYPALVLLALSVMIVHWIAISGFPHWYGGHSYGPRLMTGVVPWLVLLSIFGLQAMLTARENQAKVHRLKSWRTQKVLGSALLLASVIINALGATSHATALWNMRPVNVDEQPSRIWDWRHPQFLATWQKSSWQ